MSVARGSAEPLPDFLSPPVKEIVGSVQFNSLPKLGLQEIIKVGAVLDDYELTELQPQLPPIQELPPGATTAPPFPQLFLGAQHQRALYVSQNKQFTAQLQRDRIAINERRLSPDEDPSSLHVWPQLERLGDAVETELTVGQGFGPSAANVVELTYVNVIPNTPADHVLRILARPSGDSPYASPENVGVRFSFPMVETDAFRGRLHVEAGPAVDAGMPVLQLRLICRRLVTGGEPLAEVFDSCHRYAVNAFLAITEVEMHKVWRRVR